MEVLESKITDKFQVTLPKNARKLLGVSVGDTIAFLVEEKTAHVVVKPADVLERMSKLAGGKSFPKISEEVRKARKEW
ncbi:AbrB/MazE/SpoVT family DNA-binding domain-containing protein [Candidatus Micrarchaeota archaeon]|nr:AbrB/MazE/SpoVT family DNA-binding domain-containing protein [Candidatus Micrarchaeota archaeon]